MIEAVGLTFIITSSKLLKPLREYVSSKSIFFGELLGCAQCTGVWVGFGMSFITQENWYSCFTVSLISYFLSLIALKLKL